MSVMKKLSVWLLIFILLFTIPTNVLAKKVTDGSSVAGVELEGLSIEDAKAKIEEMTATWQAGPPLVASSDYETVEIPRDIFVFDLDGTFAQLEEKMKRHWSNFFMRPKNVKQELLVELSPDASESIGFPDYVDAEQTLNYALLQAKHLTEQSITLTYVDGWEMKLEEITNISLEIPEDLSYSTVEYLVEHLDGQVIEANTLFSFLESMTLPDGMDNSQDEMSFLASGLYGLVLDTDMEILERHIGKELPSYIAAGLEAVVDRENELDLKLYHTNEFNYTIESAIDGNVVELALAAPGADINMTYSVENIIDVEPRTIYRYNPDLNPGEEVVVDEGTPGQQLEVYRMVTNRDGTTDKQLLSRDFYPPQPKIVEVAVVQELESGTDSFETEEEMTESLSIQETIVDRFGSARERMNLIDECEEDPNLCENEDDEFMNLLMACALERENPVDGTQDEENDGTASFLDGFCDLLYFLFFLSLLGEFDTSDDLENDVEFDEDSFPVDWWDDGFDFDWQEGMTPPEEVS